jgi:hypothetical protein
MVRTLSTSSDIGCGLSTCTGAAGSAVCGRRESRCAERDAILRLCPSGALMGHVESLPARTGAAACAVGCRQTGSAAIDAIYCDLVAERGGLAMKGTVPDDCMPPLVRSRDSAELGPHLAFTVAGPLHNIHCVFLN